jgi:uncharacterized membrane protein
MNFCKLYIIALPVFFAIDLLWLGVFAKNLYQEQLGHLMASQVKWTVALLFYCLYLFGLVFFAIGPAVKENSWIQALLQGALFGLICYATYDLTNLATLKNWPVKIVYYDLIWGAFVSGAVSLITFWIGNMWIRSST